MGKVIKWVAILVGILIVLVAAAVVIVPMVVDVQKYKPEIEKKVAEATGRPFMLGGDLRLSVFPWIGVAVSDVHLGNPEGFKEKDFVSVKSFEVRVRLLPLLSKDIRIKRFVMVAPRIVLVKTKEGVGNWEGLVKPSGEKPSEEKPSGEKPSEEAAGAGLPFKHLEVGEFAVTEGSVLWIDQTKGERREVSEMNLRLKNVSLENPIGIDLSARLDGKPISLVGKVGPIGKEPGKGAMSLDVSLKALEELDMLLKGKIVDPATKPQYDLAVEVAPFSPRKMLAAVGQKLPVATSDPEALSSIAFKAHVKGTAQEVTVSDGKLDLDKSHLTFNAKAVDFSKPDVVFDLNLDGIEVDRYMPPASEKETEKAPKPPAKAKAKTPAKMDLGPLRRASVDGTIKVGNLKYQKAQIKDLLLKVSGKDGLFNLDPLSLKLNGGGVSIKGTLDARKDVPRFDLALEISPFSPRKLMADMGRKLPVQTADPKALSRMSLAAQIQGSPEEVKISKGKLDLDESHLVFSLNAKNFNKPDLVFDVNLDGIEVDRYMPPASEKEAGKAPKPPAKEKAKAPAKMDLAPLRRANVDGTIKVGNLNYQKAQIKDLLLEVKGKDGLFRLDPLSLKLNEGGISVKGTLDARKDLPRFDLALEISPFSPRKLMADMGHELPVQTTDPKALSRVSFAAQVQGSPEEVQVSKGKLNLDESNLTFSMKAKDFDKPDVTFDLNLDKIDVDRYMPPPTEKPAGDKAKKQKEMKKAPEGPSKKPDYGPLRKLLLVGSIKIGELKAKGAKMQDLQVKVSGKDGVFDVDPVSVKLYKGGLDAKLKMDVRQDTPKSETTVTAKGIQAGPLLKDVADKDFIEGTMKADVALKMQGDEPEQIKSSLNGKGDLLFTDGSIKGIDLAGMVRNVKATFGLAQKGGERPQTDFSELRVPFTITNGRFHTPESELMSPLIRVQAKGDAELVKETLDFRVEPKFVATLKGQGDTMGRSGVMVPVLVGGTFSSPTFRPDLKGMITGVMKEQIPQLEDLKKGVPGTQDLKDLLPGQKTSETQDLNGTLPAQKKKGGKRGRKKTSEAPASPEKAVEGLLKKALPLGE